ncbi:hypothetical protein AXF42_Ash012124 [Apostasia shenzhenica]|uniref:Uncharacterized protein n=1 Tax=Apostasia shenzhenica TaxID=1088818 RepID=A0A2I0B424_9ASPA|nr:hypothetical protein AXF42_Ash012124 [Apostasia shenzhenica]
MAESSDRRIRDPLARPDLQGELAEVLIPLTAEGFQTANWDVLFLGRNHVPVKPFIAAVKVLANETDTDLREKILAMAIRNGWCNTLRSATPVQLFRFCVWLRSADGMTAINVLRKERLLEKRVTRGLDVADVALTSALKEQISDMIAERKRLRAEHEDYLADMRRQIALRTREYEERMREHSAYYAPASTYQEMDEVDLSTTCHVLYHDECVASDEQEVDPTPENMDAFRQLHGPEAQSIHMARFLADQRRREELLVWVEEKILELVNTGDFPREKTFRSFLSSAGGGVAPEI